MIRSLAGEDLDEIKRIVKWPLREILMAYLAHLREKAEEIYRFERLEWAILCDKLKKQPDPPKPDPILKG